MMKCKKSCALAGRKSSSHADLLFGWFQRKTGLPSCCPVDRTLGPRAFAALEDKKMDGLPSVLSAVTSAKAEARDPRNKATLRRSEDGALEDGGAEGSRTPDLLIANETLYQLSYDPIQLTCKYLRRKSPGKYFLLLHRFFTRTVVISETFAQIASRLSRVLWHFCRGQCGESHTSRDARALLATDNSHSRFA